MLFRYHGPNLVVHTPAKLNLFLEVLGKRSDGYHELETLMVTVGIYDTLTFITEDAGRIGLEQTVGSSSRALPSNGAASRNTDVGDIPTDDRNLVIRAAKLLAEVTGTKLGARIHLHKRIPVAAGLAGGSSDAAATLKGLNQLWKLGLSTEDLHGLAAQLGSDVNFFLSPSPVAVCRGRGEIIEPIINPAPMHFVIAKPAAGLSTADVFRNCKPADRSHRVGPLVDAIRRGELLAIQSCLHNRLEESAKSLSREVAELTTRIRRQTGSKSLMSGSGTSCFGVCSSRRFAMRSMRALRAQQIPHVFFATSRP